VLEALSMFNEKGQREALKRLGEMLQCSEYTQAVQDSSSLNKIQDEHTEPKENQ
jgi:hypothetical protein